MTSLSETNVLLLSPLPPSTGGIVTWTDRLVRHGLPSGCRVNVVDTGIRDPRRADGSSLRAGEVRRNARIMGTFLRGLARPPFISFT